MPSDKRWKVLTVPIVVALLSSAFAASATSEASKGNAGSARNPDRVLELQVPGGQATVSIYGREFRLPSGQCSDVSSSVTLEADPGVEGLVLDTEVGDDCIERVTYFGKPRFSDSVEPETTETSSGNSDSLAVTTADTQATAAAAWSGNYIHSRHRLWDCCGVIIAAFWLHNDRRWNGSGTFVCSPGWSCFVGGQEKTYKSWNHPGTIQLWYNAGCTEFTNCFSVTADGTGNFTTDFFACDPGDKIALHNTNISYRTGGYDATYWRTSECNIAGMHSSYAVWANLTKWDQTP